MSEQLFDAEELTGEVAGVLFSADDTGFGVILLDPGEQHAWERCIGPLSQVVEGQRLRLVGRWTDHPRYGRTFEAQLYEQLTPTTSASIRAFLESERFAGIDGEDVSRVLSVFGSGAGRVIEQEPDRLVEEAGLPRATADLLHDKWHEGLALAELTRLAEPAGLPYRVVRAIYAHHGADATRIARDDPYSLLEVDSCRFAHADALARSLGVDPTDPARLRAGARAAVQAARRSEGHQYVTRQQCAERAAQLLGVDVVAASAGLDGAVEVGDLVLEELATPTGTVSAVYTPLGQAAERNLAEDLQRLLRASHPRLAPLADTVDPSDELTDGQAAAVRLAFSSPVSLLTGGPGTGKTRTIEEIVRAADEHDLNVALCAPTGRAAKRIEELVGAPATTVHRLLEARPLPTGGFVFTYGRDERLPQDLVVCDEVSMCDTRLAAALVSAVGDGAHLVLVGDPDQLPSVGPGDVLADLLASEVVPSVRLTEVHRQAAESRVVALANAVNRGEVGALPGVDGDLFMAEEPRRAAIVPRVVEAVAVRAPEYFDVEVADIQVVAPIYRGPCGVNALNEALKQRLNPAESRPEVAGWNIGDRVMQTRNDADLDVSNGDVGTVVDLDPKKRTLRVAFPRGEVTYEAKQAGDLTAAWAVTVHKSQGGEWPVVVLVLDGSHRSMLWRNLVYTAITRAQRALIVVGQADALRRAARHDVPSNRQTGLVQRLQDLLAPLPA
ncbi:MAG: AAA family ATPase [Nitriliruptorales bacterium]|nr:AAA family ATPase [Nitriliruptorales bacterium]